jgi:putative nucleotidyltransferase with HDIG domain
MIGVAPGRSGLLTGRDLLRAIVVGVAATVSLTAILAADFVPGRVSLQVGDIAPADVLAPRALTYESAILTQQARQAASQSVPPQYDYTPAKGDAAASQAAAAFSDRVAPIDAAMAATVTASQRRTLLEAAAAALGDLSEAARATLLSLSPSQWTAVRDEAARVLDVVERRELRDADLATVRVGLVAMIGGDLSTAQRTLAAELISPLITPNSSYSQTLTDLARQQAAASVAPVTVQVRQGEIIVRRGEPVTPLILEKLQAFGLDAARPDPALLAGWFALAALTVSLVLAWLWRYRFGYWRRNNVLGLLFLTLLVSAAAYKATAGRALMPYFVPAGAAGMLLAILLDGGVAVVLQGLLAVLAGAVNGGSLELAGVVFLSGLAGIVSLRRIDRFSVFLAAGVAAALTGIVVVTVFSLLGERDLTGLLQLAGASAAAGAGSALAAAGGMAILANLFGILTVVQLMELANPTQPLLRRLMVEAPGTYHHSLMVGNLAERAAEAIGADALLVRVAAYYHDIGKLANPQAFIENQAGGENIHDQLAPEASARILKQHVADGIDLAYRHRLPTPLIAFIPQHHGTSLMSYFWAKAREEAAAPYGGLATPEGQRAAAAVDDAPFRHAGPKPQSKEAAILMLADGVEASVRSLASRDESTIRAMVNQIIEERMTDGQFDECDLTFRDIDRIREAFVGQLMGIYHQRIAYPQNKIVELRARRPAGGRGGG